MSEHSSPHDLVSFFSAQDKVARWKAERENSGARLEIARIKERWFELRCQHEPLNTLTGGDREERDRILQALFYVVVGRHPAKS